MGLDAAWTWLLRLFVIAASFFFGVYQIMHLIERFEDDQVQLARLEGLLAKRSQLYHRLKKVAIWMRGSGETSCEQIISDLEDLRLCERAYTFATRAAYHPFSPGPGLLIPFLDRLDTNRLNFSQIDHCWRLVEPVYMERCDLEKMMQMLENDGKFSPVLVESMAMEKDSVFGGQLWKITELELSAQSPPSFI